MEGLVSESQLGDLWDNPLIYLGIKCSNGHCFANFSNKVWMELEINSKYVKEYDTFVGLSLGTVFKGTCKELLKVAGGNVESLNQSQKDAVECFQKFKENLVENGNHLQCLQKLNTLNAKSDSEKKMVETNVQSILACHLFTPLLSDGIVVVDHVCYQSSDNTCSGNGNTPKPECPCCKQPLNTGNTNFGCTDMWHGRADIVIKSQSSRQTVNVALGINGDTDEERGHCEPATKRTKVDEDLWYSDAEPVNSPDQVLNFVNEQFYLQTISQTILNSFLAQKNNKKLENRLVPSFLVTSKYILINFYNASKDILLVQSRPMKLFYSNGINIWAVLAVWMALHFDKFPFLFDDESYHSVSSKSGFIPWLEKFGVLEKFKNEIQSECAYFSKPATATPKISVDVKKNMETITELKFSEGAF